MLLCAELLLRYLRLAIPDLVVKAYADDTAIVSRDIWRDGPMLAKIFKDFSATSGLHLSLRKCFFMPLFPDKLGTLRCQLRERIPIWADMIIDYKGKYFGFVMGPEKADGSWTKPVKKYLERAQQWAGRTPGLQMNIAAYNTFVFSVLRFVSQLERPRIG